jgi:hypothetical protein
VSAGDPSSSPGRMFDGMDAERRQRWGDDLLAMASAVVKQGWDDYRNVWSAGEVAGVALVLGDPDELARQGETETSALNRWAFDLWGLSVGEIEVNSECPWTRKFFESLGAALRGEGRSANVGSKADIDAYAQQVHKANREAGY